MKATIFEIKRFAVHDGDGIRTTVFFKGCPLKCVWCHNPEGISKKPEVGYLAQKCIGCGECLSVCPNGAHEIVNGLHYFHRERCIACGKCADACFGNALVFYGREATVDELTPLLLKDRAYYESSGGGVTLSGGECLLYADFCQELLKRLKENGIHTAVDTCGFISKSALDKVLPYTDVFLYDLKAWNGMVHKHCTGQSNKKILENLLYLDEKGAKTEVRIPFVPEWNDSEIANIGAILTKLRHLTKVRVLAYHNYAGSKYESLAIPNTLPTRLPTDEELKTAIHQLKALGITVIE